MKNIITRMDQHGRLLIPAEIRELLNINPGDKVNLGVHGDEVTIIDSNKVLNQMHSIFTKNQGDKNNSIADGSNGSEKEGYQTKEMRDTKNEQ